MDSDKPLIFEVDVTVWNAEQQEILRMLIMSAKESSIVHWQGKFGFSIFRSLNSMKVVIESWSNLLFFILLIYFISLRTLLIFFCLFEMPPTLIKLH